ncbi:hypothetical protein BKA70DRAFT_1417214 [Coprinopsis sp. MPI-PUGE-AT-0042]|nr:hypothetical protein BKA70DRAFT_1417214 [Coprinopsis sp. MPI-PUGE-AT-0042]
MTGIPKEVVLERIRAFEIANTAPWVIRQYLSHLSLPSLTALSVWYMPDGWETTISVSEGQKLADAVELLVRRSGCQEALHSLSFRNLHPDVGLRCLLEATPNVVDLTLASLWLGRLESQAVLPKLRKITVDALDEADIVMPADLVEIITLRNPGKRVFSFQSFKKTWAFVKDD